jgi:hypothetical protein
MSYIIRRVMPENCRNPDYSNAVLGCHTALHPRQFLTCPSTLRGISARGHPIFQSISENMHNIPVVTHAFLKADLDMRTKNDRGLALRLKHACRNKSKKHARRACAGNQIHLHPTATRPTVAGGTSVGKFASQIAENIVPFVCFFLLSIRALNFHESLQ